MQPPPQFHVEILVRQNIDELRIYGDIFTKRIARSFYNLEEEARAIQEERYATFMARPSDGSDDPSGLAQTAYELGVEFYLATDALRSGIFNLTTAGLYHLLEQQCTKALSMLFSETQNAKNKDYPFERLHDRLLELQIDIHSFASWPMVNELRLIANAVKHGDGRSADELRKLRADLFEQGTFPGIMSVRPLRPLVGEGLSLTEAQFITYQTGAISFWEALRQTLV